MELGRNCKVNRKEWKKLGIEYIYIHSSHKLIQTLAHKSNFPSGFKKINVGLSKYFMLWFQRLNELTVETKSTNK